jgi:predicted porin
MKATFQLESALNTADGTGGTALFNRQSTVGLEGGFGALRFGRSTTPVHDALAATDVMEIQALTTTNLNPVSRVSNAVFYATPNTFGGFYANAVYGMSDAGSSGAGGVPNLTKSQGLSLGYKAGPLHVVGAMVVLDTTVVASVDGKTDGQVIGLTYDFGAAKLFVNSSRGQVQANVGIDTKTVNTETNLGLSVPVGAFTFLAGLGRNARTATVAGAETAATGTSTANVSGTGSGADWVLGVYYSLSKRTNVFVKTGTINKFDFGSTVASPNTANRLETSGTAIGLRHTF